MSEPAVSVVMSVYSRTYLREAVESILNQDLAGFEFVIVDDSVNAETAALLDAYAQSDARIVLHHNAENLGQTRSLNLGFGLARGRYLARQDDDDISLPGRLRAEAAYLDAHPEVGLVGTQMVLIGSDGQPLDSLAPFATDNANLQAALLAACPFCHGSVMMRRAALAGLDLYDIELRPAEDYDLWLRLAEVTQLANLEAAYYQFRSHGTSQSRRQRHRTVFNSGRALERALRRRQTDPADQERWTPAAHYYLEAAILSMGAEEEALARDSLTRGLALVPGLLNGTTTLERMLADYVFGMPVEAALAACERLFTALLPRTRVLARCRARFVSRLHMQAVFAAGQADSAGRVRAHLWSGIRQNPAWLLNRGVVARLLRVGRAAARTRPG
jgi:glycosyltransferase involved in cell wall biosynthesis